MSKKNRLDPGALTPIDPKSLAATPRASTNWMQERIGRFAELDRDARLTTIYVSPQECAIWPGNGREYAQLTQATCQELIDSIAEEGGNRVPVVVRPIAHPQPDEPKYELLVGTRRHWSVSWLNANGYDKMRLLAIQEEISDEAAFRLADIENRARTDISDMERARNYKAAVNAYYDGVASRMAKRLQISESSLSRLLALAELPSVIIGAFAAPSEITVKHSEILSPLLREPKLRSLVEAEAKIVAGEQAFRTAEGHAPVEAPHRAPRHSAAAHPKPAGRPERPPLMAHSGAVVGKILKDSAKEGVTVQITADDSVSEDEVIDALRLVIRGAKVRNK
jgi:ParB family chromosome partitioning protein